MRSILSKVANKDYEGALKLAQQKLKKQEAVAKSNPAADKTTGPQIEAYKNIVAALQEAILHIDQFNNKAKYLETEKLKGYDVLLNMFEKGYTQVEYDEFFSKLKEKLVPFVKKVCSLKKDLYPFTNFTYEKEKQIQVAKYMGDVLCFDFERGAMAESEHPFTWNTSTDNVRITNHFYKNDFNSSLFSAIHEFGHAIYEQNVDPKYNETLIGGGVSMAMHESQSRFYENIIGRDYHFWEVHFPKLKEIYKEQFNDVSVDQFYLYIFQVTLIQIK